MIIANFVLAYDIKMPDGVEGRYKNLDFGASVSLKLGRSSVPIGRS
jgi:hypothetical protein